jgi:FtsP/CotA-like multicopper oxidase with cupredoxin domain
VIAIAAIQNHCIWGTIMEQLEPRVGLACKGRRLVAMLAATAILFLVAPIANAQPTACPPPIDITTTPLPEIVSQGGRLRGTMVLADGQQAFELGNGKCVSQLLRFYQKQESNGQPPTTLPLPVPGPTLRARLGDVIELTFLNQINTLDYGQSIDVSEKGDYDPAVPGAGCDTSSTGYPVMKSTATPPGPPVTDTWPNCFHGSTSGNIHYHGTHTSPNGTADNVFLNVRPSPRDKDGKPVVTTESVAQELGSFFDVCEQKLKADNLLQWPKVWSDLPTAFTDNQQALLIADGQGKPPPQQLWLADQKAIAANQFPQYYIGAFPYCFLLPKYPGTVPQGSVLEMGQSPGTHWYHAHKHGSTALDVSNGMAGAFIIEGDGYDGYFNKMYDKFRKNTSSDWSRQQPTLVVNQYGNTPGLERGGGAGSSVFAVNGQQNPNLSMYPGEVQLWRIVNASSVDGFYISSLPKGFTWRQTAQDGVQFDDFNYKSRAQRPVFVAPGNRIDLLVRAPSGVPRPHTPPTPPIPISIVKGPSVSATQTNAPPPTTSILTLLSVVVTGTGRPMALVPSMPPRPSFLNDIKPTEVVPAGARTLTFLTSGPGGQRQHTINGKKFEEGNSVDINPLNTVEEWKIVNETAASIDHPFHIHLNPFQVVEVFDPNAPLLDANGHPVPVLDNKGQPVTPAKYVPQYVVSEMPPTLPPGQRTLKPGQWTLKPGQCWINPNDQTTWKQCAQASSRYPGSKTNIWWDVFPIPAATSFPPPVAQGKPTPPGAILIPGYFKLRSRFVDYPGSYVVHCHILAHEDRGMMVQVNLATSPSMVMQHH